jgi:hypothetical protein
MDLLRPLFIALLWYVGVPFVIIAVAIALGYDWKKRSNFGLTTAPNPRFWSIVLFVIVGLAIVVLAAAHAG